jgi:phosphoserine phosphatase RsbU/P
MLKLPRASSTPSTGASSHGAGHRARVWVVDDSALEAESNRQLLAPHYEVDVLCDGATLLERLAQGPLPTLVLMDWQMPGVSGLEACRFLRERFDEVTLPVLILTMMTEPGAPEQSLAAGANDYVAKPCQAAELLARVRTLVRVRELAEALHLRELERSRALSEAEALMGRLRESDERLRRVVEGSGTGTWELNVASDSLSADERMRELFLHPEGEPFTRQALLAAIHPADSEWMASALAGAMAGVNAGRYLTECRVTRGERVRWVESRGQVSFDGAGRPARFTGTSVDITQRKEAEEALHRAQADLQRRAEFEQQLIGIVSHDLRNPISVVLMSAATLLKHEMVEERVRRSVARILSAAERASRMIHDLLDFTQARLGGGLPVHRAAVDLQRLVSQAVEESQVASPGRTIELEQQGEARGTWDGDRLSQVMGNLLANALHYSPADSAVRVTTRADEDAVLISVHNTGSPIAPAVLPRLFKPLQRGVDQGSLVRSVGLGLYIVDQVVRAHGGTVEVESLADTGTTFSVRLPLAQR